MAYEKSTDPYTRIIAALAATYFCLAVATTGAMANEYLETDDPTFLGLVYKLSCKTRHFTAVYEDNFMGTPLDVKGSVPTVIDLAKRTIRDTDLVGATPIYAKFKAFWWKASFEKRIQVTAIWRKKTVRVLVQINGSPDGIKSIEFTKPHNALTARA